MRICCFADFAFVLVDGGGLRLELHVCRRLLDWNAVASLKGNDFFIFLLRFAVWEFERRLALEDEGYHSQQVGSASRRPCTLHALTEVLSPLEITLTSSRRCLKV